MISLQEARRLITDHIPPRAPRRLPLAEAHGLILAEDVTADAAYPDGDRSQMDGYVVRADAVPGLFRCVGEIPAGAVPSQPLEPGTCARIFTGAMLPPCGGRVVIQEDAAVEKDGIKLPVFSERMFVRQKGCEALPGHVILRAGSLLGAVELAMLAQVGAVFPLVIPPPTVRHLATGGELVDPSKKPGPGRIRDTNSSLLRALLTADGITDLNSGRIADDPEAMLLAADGNADLLLISGGAGAGDFDFGAVTLRRLGWTIHFDRVNLRPGKPLTFATRGNRAAFVIPGNPVSHFVCYHTALRLAVELAAGRPPSWPALWVDLQDAATLQPDARETWWPATAFVREGRLLVQPKPWSSSGNTFALAGTNALVQVNTQSPRDGQALTLLLTPPATVPS
ncbi:MAG: molybdopterin molybdenumtransferase MoeA [Verrucomicrobiales bacterium]|nr:molybdopterin molybdenumtransferase MoeA [Verrucomicrobiales bacterium]